MLLFFYGACCNCQDGRLRLLDEVRRIHSNLRKRLAVKRAYHLRYAIGHSFRYDFSRQHHHKRDAHNDEQASGHVGYSRESDLARLSGLLHRQFE